MKILHAITFASGLLAITASLHAEPQGGSHLERDFLGGYNDDAGWMCGAFVHNRDRDVTMNSTAGTLETTQYAAYIGHTVVLPWITLYGIAGSMNGKFSPGPTPDDSDSFLYGAAVNFDIFAHEIPDPMLMENQVRVNASLTYLGSQVEAEGDTQAFEEFEASLTASLVNDVYGNTLYLPQSVAFFAGPVFSQLLGNDINDDADQEIGITFGLMVFHTKRISYYIRGEEFGKAGYAGGLNIRF